MRLFAPLAAPIAAPLAVLLAVVIVHAAADFALSSVVCMPWAGKGITEVTKGIANLPLNKRKLYYILDKQCTGEISSKYLPCAAPQLLRVAVTRARSPPRVLVPDSLRAAYVWRAPPCRGAVAVTVEASC